VATFAITKARPQSRTARSQKTSYVAARFGSGILSSRPSHCPDSRTALLEHDRSATYRATPVGPLPKARLAPRLRRFYRSSTSVASSHAERPSARDRGKRDWGSNVSRADIAGRDANSQLRRRLRSSRSIETTHLQTPSRKRTQRRVGPSSTTRLCSFRWRQAAPVGNEFYLRNSSPARTQRAAAVETPRAGSHVHIVARILPFRRGHFNARI
jgi:hypothetical protein